MSPFTLKRLESGDVRPEFDCGDDDLNDYYHTDSIKGSSELISVTYIAEVDGNIVGFFSVSNDSIKKENLTRSKFKRIFKLIPREKRYSSMPAVKIGRLGVHKDHQCQGYGRGILDYIKVWFTQGNKTGCRFIVVDAYNNPRALKFYSDNEFEFLIEDSREDTRLMYFDLIKFRE